ncbi:hypothetical protein [Burkholderia pseudomallei]
MLRRRALYATVWGIRRLRSGAKTPLTFVAVRKNRQNRRAGEPAGPAGNARRDGNGHDAGVGRWRGRVGRFVSALRRHYHFSFDMPP